MINFLFKEPLIVSRIAIVKPEKARSVEDYLIQAARSGRLGGARVTEGDLVNLLEKVQEQQSNTKSKITYQRRSAFDSDDDP